ncbi:uncharacterized protein FIBRA_06468 [Fibroporia radiculosa]|uniref:Uncharacterized protein n=1 Tax=Fibroporia radiculosa TaxID=599839 RepID=J4HZ57_9APHY|nr:uncharacterized protein FIBRA_06468 [Fibroporia radiculosa]CCM04297.1 predicted protein [Fibroporia radiculosa]
MPPSGPSLVASYPPELLSAICAHIFAAGIPPSIPSLDPLLCSDNSVPTASPSSYPSAHWQDSVIRKTLASLCTVNRAWSEAARPWLWRKIEIRLPHSWLSLVDQIAVHDDEELDQDQAALLVDQTMQQVESAALATKDAFGDLSDKTAAFELHEKVLEQLSGPDGSIPPELLTPLASRDPSPRRLRHKSKSPVRWQLLRSISDAVRIIMENDMPGLYVPEPNDPHPGRLVRHLDFNYFRTIGMRRSIEEGVNNRFVTGDRLELVLKEMPSLLAFGATEYMDGALTYPVLKELFLRGAVSRGRGRPPRGRDVVMYDPNDTEQEDMERRRECKELEAIDLTGCVSVVFVDALLQFVQSHLIDHSDLGSSDTDDEGVERDRGRARSRNAVHDEQDDRLLLSGLRRLGLRGVKSIQSHILSSFVLAFPSLTHLDLSCTRVTPDLLDALGTSRMIKLQSLALERCNWLTGESIRTFLVDAPAARGIRELSLYGDWTYPSPLSEDDLREIFLQAPCFRSGKLVYLDLSSAPLSRAVLADCELQPCLRSLGLSHIRNLELSAVADFLKDKAPNVEVLTLVATSPELGYGSQVVPVRQATVHLHAHLIRPLCTPPFSFSLTPGKKSAPAPTRLRVIELAVALLASVGSGAGSWRVVKSKGGRGWYVDSASGWIAERGCEKSVLRRDLPSDHPWRMELERLADANGNVSSGVGWHARKMEVLHGHGMLGREAGLYGAVSYAYQG